MRLALPIVALALLAGCAAPAVVAPPAVAPAPNVVAAPSAMPVTPAVRNSDPVPAGAFLFFEDFERPATLAKTWDLPDVKTPVTWRLLQSKTCSGLYVMLLGNADHADYTMAPGTYTMAVRDPIDLTKAVHPVLTYAVKGVTAPIEAVQVTAEVRKGTTGEWTPVGRIVPGDYVAATMITAKLSAFAGSPIGLRFHATTAAATDPAKGFYLDDVQIIDAR